MNPLSMGIGPYGMGLMDPSLYPIMQDYKAAVTQCSNGVPGVVSPSTTGASNGTTGTGNSTGVRRYPAYGTDEYWDYQRHNQEKIMENSIERGKQWQIRNYAINGPMNIVSKAADVLRDKILENEQDQIQCALQAYKNAIKEAYYPNEEEVDDELLTAQAKTFYENKFGTRIEDDLRANGTSSFWNGFIKTASLGFFGDDVSVAENIAEMNDQPVSSKQKVWRKTGKVTGSVASCAAIGAGIGACFGGIGAGPGAIAGAIVGLVKGLFFD